MENPFEKGFSKPFPKLFDLPLLRNGFRCVSFIHAGVAMMAIGKLLSRSS